MDPKSQKCIFVGYGEGQYGFRLWDHVANKITRSRDVVFNENIFLALQTQVAYTKFEYVPFSALENIHSHGSSKGNLQLGRVGGMYHSPTFILYPAPSTSSSMFSLNDEGGNVGSFLEQPSWSETQPPRVFTQPPNPPSYLSHSFV